MSSSKKQNPKVSGGSTKKNIAKAAAATGGKSKSGKSQQKSGKKLGISGGSSAKTTGDHKINSVSGSKQPSGKRGTNSGKLSKASAASGKNKPKSSEKLPPPKETTTEAKGLGKNLSGKLSSKSGSKSSSKQKRSVSKKMSDGPKEKSSKMKMAKLQNQSLPAVKEGGTIMMPPTFRAKDKAAKMKRPEKSTPVRKAIGSESGRAKSAPPKETLTATGKTQKEQPPPKELAKADANKMAEGKQPHHPLSPIPSTQVKAEAKPKSAPKYKSIAAVAVPTKQTPDKKSVSMSVKKVEGKQSVPPQAKQSNPAPLTPPPKVQKTTPTVTKTKTQPTSKSECSKSIAKPQQKSVTKKPDDTAQQHLNKITSRLFAPPELFPSRLGVTEDRRAVQVNVAAAPPPSPPPPPPQSPIDLTKQSSVDLTEYSIPILTQTPTGAKRLDSVGPLPQPTSQELSCGVGYLPVVTPIMSTSTTPASASSSTTNTTPYSSPVSSPDLSNRTISTASPSRSYSEELAQSDNASSRSGMEIRLETVPESGGSILEHPNYLHSDTSILEGKCGSGARYGSSAVPYSADSSPPNYYSSSPSPLLGPRQVLSVRSLDSELVPIGVVTGGGGGYGFATGFRRLDCRNAATSNHVLLRTGLVKPQATCSPLEVSLDLCLVDPLDVTRGALCDALTAKSTMLTLSVAHPGGHISLYDQTGRGLLLVNQRSPLSANFRLQLDSDRVALAVATADCNSNCNSNNNFAAKPVTIERKVLDRSRGHTVQLRSGGHLTLVLGCFREHAWNSTDLLDLVVVVVPDEDTATTLMVDDVQPWNLSLFAAKHDSVAKQWPTVTNATVPTTITTVAAATAASNTSLSGSSSFPAPIVSRTSIECRQSASTLDCVQVRPAELATEYLVNLRCTTEPLVRCIGLLVGGLAEDSSLGSTGYSSNCFELIPVNSADPGQMERRKAVLTDSAVITEVIVGPGAHVSLVNGDLSPVEQGTRLRPNSRLVLATVRCIQEQLDRGLWSITTLRQSTTTVRLWSGECSVAVVEGGVTLVITRKLG